MTCFNLQLPPSAEIDVSKMSKMLPQVFLYTRWGRVGVAGQSSLSLCGNQAPIKQRQCGVVKKEHFLGVKNLLMAFEIYISDINIVNIVNSHI